MLLLKGFNAMKNDPFRDGQPKIVTFNLLIIATLNTTPFVQTL